MCSDRVHLLQVLNIPDLQARIMEWFRWEKPSKIRGPPCPSSEQQPPAPRQELEVGNPAHRNPPGPIQEWTQHRRVHSPQPWQSRDSPCCRAGCGWPVLTMMVQSAEPLYSLFLQ